MKFALIGNPNCGKTTLFNTLTGSTAHVGNWPGVTVNKKEGYYKKLPEKAAIVDLPGIYSLSPYTPEELVTRDFLIEDSPDCVINVVDATNLERNLYLTTQLLEIDVPLIIALNMIDVVNNDGTYIDIKVLEETFKVPVVPISALKNKGVHELMTKAYEIARTPRVGLNIFTKQDVRKLISDTTLELKDTGIKSPLFHAIKLIEKDEVEMANHTDIYQKIEEEKLRIPEDEFEGDYEAIIADARYQFITDHLMVALGPIDNHNQMSRSDKIDKVLTHKIWSIPFFILIMFFVFHFVFSNDLLYLNAIFNIKITSPSFINFLTGMGYQGEALDGIPSIGVFLQNWVEYGTSSLIGLIRDVMPINTWYTSLVCDGILAGIAAIFSFIPQILLLFLFISILEDSGYMSRVAFIMDKAFRRFGLSGKAFIPLLMGFGCSVPAMMATKTLEDERERDLTIRLSTFFSCGAKAPIWALLSLVVAGKFLGDIFVFSIYLFGIVMAIISAIIIKLVSKNHSIPPFIMELPSYHRPQFKNLMALLWEKFKHFIYKAFTIITASVIVVWFLSNFSWAFWNGLTDINNSMLASIGRFLRIIFYPLGFSQGSDGWKYSVATITGLIAKEDVVATLASLGLNSSTISLSNPAIYSFAIYNLLTLPCFASIATAKSESTKKGFLFTLLWWLGSAYILSTLIYYLGLLWTRIWWLGLILTILIIASFITWVVIKSKKKALIMKGVN